MAYSNGDGSLASDLVVKSADWLIVETGYDGASGTEAYLNPANEDF